LAAYNTSIDLQAKKKEMKLEMIKKRMRLLRRGVERTDGGQDNSAKYKMDVSAKMFRQTKIKELDKNQKFISGMAATGQMNIK